MSEETEETNQPTLSELALTSQIIHLQTENTQLKMQLLSSELSELQRQQAAIQEQMLEAQTARSSSTDKETDGV